MASATPLAGKAPKDEVKDAIEALRYQGIAAVGSAKLVLNEALNNDSSASGDDAFQILNAVEAQLHQQLDVLCRVIGRGNKPQGMV